MERITTRCYRTKEPDVVKVLVQVKHPQGRVAAKTVYVNPWQSQETQQAVERCITELQERVREQGGA